MDGGDDPCEWLVGLRLSDFDKSCGERLPMRRGKARLTVAGRCPYKIAEKAGYSVLFVESDELDQVCPTYWASTTRHLCLIKFYVYAGKDKVFPASM